MTLVETLPPVDVVPLFARYKADPTFANRNTIVEQFLPLVSHHANRIHDSLPASVQVSDLQSWGVMGLMQAVERFDPDRGLKFTTFAGPRIRGAIYDGLRSNAHRCRVLLDKRKKVEAVKDQLTARLHRQPLADEVQQHFNSQGRRMNLRHVAAATEISLNELTREIDNQTFDDRGERRRHEAAMAAIEARDIIDFVLHNCGMAAALLLRCCYLESRTMVEAGEWLGVTSCCVSIRMNRLLKQLKSRFAA